MASPLPLPEISTPIPIQSFSFSSPLYGADANDSPPLPLPPLSIALPNVVVASSSPSSLPAVVVLSGSTLSSFSGSSSPPSSFLIFLLVSHICYCLPPTPFPPPTASSFIPLLFQSCISLSNLASPFRSSSSFYISSLDLPCFQHLAFNHCIHRLLQLCLVANRRRLYLVYP
ncbi:hypothetical protein ACLOJK_027309 [Asimina triloba]